MKTGVNKFLRGGAPGSLPGSLLPLLGHALWSGGVVALAASQAQAGGIDGVQLKLAWQLQQPLRWDNLAARSPYWLAGAQPQAQAGLEWEVLELQPGQRVSLRVPGTEFVRAQAVQGQLQEDDLQFWRSNGVGSKHALAVREGVRREQQGAALLLDQFVDETRVIVVERPSTATGSLKFGLFVSRHENLGTLAPYRQLHELAAPEHRLLLDSEGAAQRVWALAPAQAVKVRVHGPARLALGGRWQYPELEAGLVQTWQVTVQARRLEEGASTTAGTAAGTTVPAATTSASANTIFNAYPDSNAGLQHSVAPASDAAPVPASLALEAGPVLAELQYVASSDSDDLARLDGSNVLLSDEKTAYFEVPAGDHELTLLSNGPILARLLQQELFDYRLPQWNAGLDLSAAASAAASAAQATGSTASVTQASPWALPQAELQNAISADADVALQAARRLQQDNRHRDGSLLASAVMQTAAQERRDMPAVREAAREFKDQSTHWQDVLPAQKWSPQEARFAWYLNPRLLNIGERGWGKVIAARHEDALLAGLDSGRFVALPVTAEAPMPASTPMPESAPVLASASAPATISAPAPLTDAAPTALSYVLPQRSAVSNLRLAVQAGAQARGERLMLQFDQRAPVELKLDQTLPVDAFAADAVSAALQWQSWRAGELGGSTVGAAFSRSKMPAALVAASVLDLPLPAEVKTVRVWRAGKPDATVTPDTTTDSTGAGTAPLYVSVKVRVAPPYALSGQGMLTLLSQAQLPQSGEQGLQSLLAALERPDPASKDSTRRQLDSQLQGLARLIGSEHNLLSSGVAAPGAAAPALPAPFATPAQENAVNQAAMQAVLDANLLAGGSNWLPALEKWAEAAASSDPALREQAEQGRVQALLGLGETFLAEQVLKQRLLFGATVPVRQQAAAQLFELYRNNRDDRSALTLACSALLRTPGNAALRQLVPVLLDNDQTDLALQAALLLPSAERPLPLMLRAALQKNWLALFEQLRLELPGAAEREFWLGQQFAHEGKLAQAATSFAISARLAKENGAARTGIAAMTKRGEIVTAAAATSSEAASLPATGVSGAAAADSLPAPAESAQAFARHLQQGQELQQQISVARANGNGSLPPALVAQWASWQARHPGPQQWQEVPGQIIDYAGAAGLYAVNRDLVSNAYRAEPGKPVRMRFMGPLTLRFEARPLHAASSQTMLEGWFKIEEKAPLSASATPPAANAAIQGSVAGLLAASGSVQADATRPALRTWPVAISQNWPASGWQMLGHEDLLPGQSVLKDLAFGPGWHELELGGENMPLLISAKALLPALPLPVLPLLTEDTLRGQVRVAAQAVKPSLWGCRTCTTVLMPHAAQPLRLRPVAPPLAPDFADMPAISMASQATVPDGEAQNVSDMPGAAIAVAVAAQRWDELLAMPQPQAPEQVIDYLSALLWRSEQAPLRGHSLLAKASSLQAAHPEMTGLGALMERLSRNSDWLPVQTVQASAGMRSRPITSWEPETPAMRVRRAMLSSLHPEEYLLAGGNRLMVNLFNTKSSALTLVLHNRDVGGMPPLPLIAQVQIGNGPLQSVALATGSGEVRLPLMLEKGRQSVKVWIKKPLANQFLGTRLLEKNARPGPGGQPVLDATERFYHVATKAEPIRLLLPGPVWVRVDHWVDGQTHSRYRLLDQPWNKFSLAPREGQKEGLFRLFTRQVMPARPVTPPRRIEVPTLPVAAPLVALDAAPEHKAPLAATYAQKAALDTAPASKPPLAVAPVNKAPLAAAGFPLFGLLAGAVSGGSSGGSGTGGTAASVAGAPLHDNLPLGKQEGGTWTLYGSVLQQPPLSNDGTVLDGGSRAVLESGARYRLMDVEKHNWYRGDVFARKTQQGGPAALGVQASIGHDPGMAGLYVGFDAALLLQNNTRGVQGGTNTPAASNLALSVFVKQEREISPTLTHEPQLRMFLRQSSNLNDAASLSDEANQYLFALNRQRTKFGVEIGDKLDYRPHLDTVLSSQVKAVSRENLAPDSLALRFGGKQMLGPLVTGVHFDAAHFLADGGRIPARTLRSAAFIANYERWLSNQHRIEIGLNLNHDLNRHRLSAGIGIALHLGNGRAYRDFAPGEVAFPELRRRRAPEGDALQM